MTFIDVLISLLKWFGKLLLVLKEIGKIEDIYKYDALSGNPKELTYNTSGSDKRSKFLNLRSIKSTYLQKIIERLLLMVVLIVVFYFVLE
ncbi:MAG: hypothetical protein RO257_03120 [Candidatus Kapabacteria bacterium]|nr:hypothetical protein [Candidatus Kapabacteria bacterium]